MEKVDQDLKKANKLVCLLHVVAIGSKCAGGCFFITNAILINLKKSLLAW